jgi:carbamoyltransferase
VKKSVTVLGIHDGHDAGAALIRDGKVLAAIQEERPRAIKHYSGTPEQSIRNVFKIANIEPNEINLVAIAGLVRTHAPLKERPLRVRLFERISPIVASKTFAKLYVSLLHKFRKMKELNRIFKELEILEKETVFVDHHLAHAACAYRYSPWSYEEPVIILTADGAGDGLSSTVSIGQNGIIHRIAESIYYDSLGNVLYSEITRFLGLKPWDHEYKVMGLAPYGKAEYCIDQIRKIIRIHPKNPLQFQNTIHAYTNGVQSKLRKLLAGQRFDNIAAATQQWFEELMVKWVKNAIKETELNKIVCAGGLFLNVKTNKKIIELPEIDAAFFYPAAGDDGLPVGAALHAYHTYCMVEGIKSQKEAINEIYYGPAFSNEEIKNELKNTGLKATSEYYEDIDSVIGELLVEGKIIARCSGRLEWGPRALGNRSILADARNLKMVRKINFAIKHRDFWMPFAPVMLEERMNDYVVNGHSAPYMILAFDTTDQRDDLIAAIHPLDSTCRPQILKREWNPGYYKTIKVFEEKTGVGVLLNTSFNLHGYPIVCTPQQALWTLQNSALDGLALGNYLIKQ